MSTQTKKSRQRVPRTRAGGTLTESGYFSFIRSGLRAKWVRYPVRYQVLRKASRPVTGQRHKTEYQCSVCEGWFKQKEVEVDHYPNACGSLRTYEDLPRFCENLFCEEDNLRVICKTCHKEHSNEQRNER